MIFGSGHHMLTILVLYLPVLFAITDIETTGGYAGAHGITEICVLVTDGQRIVEKFETLVNPHMPIPRHITALTGITSEMVANAPDFENIAADLYRILEGKVFVAHSVNFDYSFINAQLKQAGYELKSPKLCTVRYGKKVFPGLPSYSLGNFCRSMNIPVHQRHRAAGDCHATCLLFFKMREHDSEDTIIKQFLKHGSREPALPTHVDASNVSALPYCSGVYYFHDQKGKIIYTGKAANIRKRVLGHFTNNSPGKQKQEFLRNIHTISFRETATELMAFILESAEIKRLWPKYNKAQKRGERRYGIYRFEDRQGFVRLGIEVRKKITQPVYEVYYLNDGYQVMKRLIADFELCSKWCFIDRRRQADIPENETCTCGGACSGSVSQNVYNERVGTAIRSLKESMVSFCITGKGLTTDTRSCILAIDGVFYGMGDIAAGKKYTMDELKNLLEQLPANQFINGLVQQQAVKHPESALFFNEKGVIRL
jgi:DNA polymerase III subunit epsilon